MGKEPKQIRTEINIQANPSTIWRVLADFEKYGEWNPFIRSISGTPTEGSKITARIEPPGASGMTFRPTLLSVKENKELRWLGHLFFPGLFDGEHIFELHAKDDGSTHFVQREVFGGILVPLFSKMLDHNTVAGFILMNEKLKELAEQSEMNKK